MSVETVRVWMALERSNRLLKRKGGKRGKGLTANFAFVLSFENSGYQIAMLTSGTTIPSNSNGLNPIVVEARAKHKFYQRFIEYFHRVWNCFVSETVPLEDEDQGHLKRPVRV